MLYLELELSTVLYYGPAVEAPADILSLKRVPGPGGGRRAPCGGFRSETAVTTRKSSRIETATHL
jgi:hypothetical protein